MAEIQIELDSEEREYLLELLESVLKDTLVEEHRTRAPNYRQIVLRRENLLQSVLTKIRQQPVG